MAPSDDSADHRTLIYVLVTVIITLAGVAIILWGTTSAPEGATLPSILVSVGTSVFAGGLAGMTLGIMRHLDDRGTDLLQKQNTTLRKEFTGVASEIRDEIREARQSLSRSVRVENSSSLRCISDTEIRDAFRAAFQRARDSSRREVTIDVDVLGLKLHRFLDDQLAWLLSQNQPTHVRLLLQNPDLPIFAEICDVEGRSTGSTIKDIAATLRLLKDARERDGSLISQTGDVQVSLRFFDSYQPVTLFRVGDTCCARPRINTPRGAATRFYERYEKQTGELHFSVYDAHFRSCWEQSGYRLPAAITTNKATGLRQDVNGAADTPTGSA